MDEPNEQLSWRTERRTGIGAIALAGIIGAILWLGIYRYAPPIADSASLGGRMLFALKCVAVATLFCFVGGVEAVAHERLQSAAFDPLKGYKTRRLGVNLRYLQNSLEQLVVLAVGLFGLASYLTTGESMRAVLATTVVWIVSRFAFWIGYHHSAAMRGIGAPGMLAAMLALLYVAWRIGNELAGSVGGWAIIGGYLLLEALLFRATRAEARSGGRIVSDDGA
jgi:MAPEG family